MQIGVLWVSIRYLKGREQIWHFGLVMNLSFLKSFKQNKASWLIKSLQTKHLFGRIADNILSKKFFMSQALFDRKLYRHNQTRHSKAFAKHNFLHHEIAQVMLEQIQGFDSKFEQALEISAKDGFFSDLLLKNGAVEGVFGTILSRGLSAVFKNGACTICDDEFLPFRDQSFNLVSSNLSLQHINIIPQFLVDVKRILRKNGVFVASFFGENNLLALKKAVFDAENEVFGRVSPRFIPVIDVKNAGALWQKAGFGEVVSSLETIEVSYGDAMSLMRDLKFMGQGNVLLKRDKKWLNRKFFDAILNNYAKIMGCEGGVRAVFEVVLVVGRKN